MLAMLAGKAVIVNGYKCIGHSLCAEACPVGAITMVMASPSMGADMPYLTPEYETSIHEPVHRRGTRRPGADQECSESGTRLHRYHRQPGQSQAGRLRQPPTFTTC